MLRGECGYYLTIYESAVQYLVSLELADTDRDTLVRTSSDFGSDTDYSVLDLSNQSHRKSTSAVGFARTIAPPIVK